MKSVLEFQKVKKKYFTREELRQFFFVAIVLALFVSFGQWGDGERFFVDGFPNFLQALHLTFLLVFFHLLAKKWIGRKLGYLVHFQYAPGLLFLGFIIAFFSGGSIPFLIMGYTTYELVPHLRVHIKQGGYRHGDIAKIVVGSHVVLWAIAWVAKGVFLNTQLDYFSDIVILALLLSFYSLIPFELLKIFALRTREKVKIIPSDGLSLLYYSRGLYVFVFAFFVFFSALIFIPSFWSLFLAFFLALACYYVFLRYIEIKTHAF